MKMFEGPISNNKEKINLPPLPLGRPWQKLFYFILLNHMELLIFMFESPISNEKLNRNFVPPLLGRPWYFFFQLL